MLSFFPVSFSLMLYFPLLMGIIVFGAVVFMSGGLDWLQAIQVPNLITLRQVTPVEIICFTLGFVISALTIIIMAVKGSPFKSKLGLNLNAEAMKLP